MAGAGISRADWEDLLVRYHDLERQRKAAQKRKDRPAAVAADTQMDQLERQYYASLPVVNLTCCPFDHLPLRRTFDPHGVNGFWWKVGRSTSEPPACEHYCLLRGAVSYQGLAVPGTGSWWEMQPGPEVPYVIPRVLSLDGMVAVMGRVEMTSGYVAYPIGYFSAAPQHPEDLAAAWCQNNHSYISRAGQAAWRTDNDPWDFDLQPWIDAGKVLWCPPGSSNTIVVGPPEPCPYLNLPGERRPFLITESKAFPVALPDGSQPDPWD
jgi:hypothetical protein